MIKFRFLYFFHGCGEASGRRQIAGSEDCQCPDINVCYTDTVMERRAGGLLRFEKKIFCHANFCGNSVCNDIYIIVLYSKLIVCNKKIKKK